MGSGDADAARDFVRRFQRTIFAVAFAVIRDAGLAEDIAQQALEHAWRYADLYDPRRGTVRAWLTRITHNLAVDTARVHRPIPVAPPDLAELLDAITRGAERDELSGETSSALAGALAALPANQARGAVLAAVHGFTAREIAEIEGIPLGTAKSRIRIALEKLHAALSQRGDDD
jgi:RNA polymerase sigma-70 factor (ECF subfamily)